jgi:hypothetical protein
MLAEGTESPKEKKLRKNRENIARCRCDSIQSKADLISLIRALKIFYLYDFWSGL